VWDALVSRTAGSLRPARRCPRCAAVKPGSGPSVREPVIREPLGGPVGGHSYRLVGGPSDWLISCACTMAVLRRGRETDRYSPPSPYPVARGPWPVAIIPACSEL
jgi:hypothetical protein